MIAFNDLARLIAKGLEDVALLFPYYDTEIEISGSNEDKNPKKQVSYFLETVYISNLPTENIWIFESEKNTADCLRGGSKTVEKSILHLKDNRLYVFMIELKSRIDRCEQLKKKVRDKFECSMERIAIFISDNPTFKEIEHLRLFPVGILCYNKDEYDISQGGSSDICQAFVQYKKMANPKQIISIEPVTLNKQSIPMLFLQNPTFVENNDSQENTYRISFEKIMGLL